MLSGSSEQEREPLRVIPMALALAVAALVGASSGLLWESAMDKADAAQSEEEAASEDASAADASTR